uniref:uncharacterized protein LOC120955812 n=1 Tax=Anopheles coluzzii TaxID=1518534 RepID=UPI0020FFB187|nr:uncharacterized protein LOC120955812 [Anopheles coluzzii]
MSRVPVSSSYSRPRSGLADAAVDNVRPESLASLSSLAPSLSQYALGNSAGAVGAVAGGESSMARGAVDGFTATPVGQLGVTAFTEGIYTEGGHINPAFSEAMTNSAGQMLTELVGEETMDKMERMEQKMARAVDKITDVEVSAGEMAMVAGVMDYLPEGEEEPAVPEDVPDAGETPDLFTTPLEEPVEADVTVPDMQELNVGELGRMGEPTEEYIPQMEDAGDADADGCCCCCCCGEDGGDDLCGCGDLCDCGCGSCCGCGGLLGCGDCGDCFGCGDCIGCADCADCCSFDCSIM